MEQTIGGRYPESNPYLADFPLTHAAFARSAQIAFPAFSSSFSPREPSG
jgi:hypothetical protein